MSLTQFTKKFRWQVVVSARTTGRSHVLKHLPPPNGEVMFDAAPYQAMYARMFERAVPVEIVTGGSTYPVDAVIRQYTESELIEGGTLQMGDLQVLLKWEQVESFAPLGASDRLIVDGRSYSFIHFDEHTRAVGTTKLAVEAVCRGGGNA